MGVPEYKKKFFVKVSRRFTRGVQVCKNASVVE